MPEASDIGVGILLEIVALVGLVATFYIGICLVRYKEIKKNPHMIFVLNVMICDLGHLSIVCFHVVPELWYYGIEWGDLETFIMTCNIVFWYGTLLNMTFVAASRLIAIRFPAKANTLLTSKNVIITVVAGWLICVFVALIPTLNVVCCIKIFNLHSAAEDEEEMSSTDVNYWRILTHALNGVVVLWTIFCSFQVIKVLRKTKNSPAALSVSNEDRKRNIAKIQKLSTQFAGITGLYLVVWLSILIHDVFVHDEITGVIARVFYTLNSTLTPFVVCRTNSRLQRSIRVFWHKRCKCCFKNVVTPVSFVGTTHIHNLGKGSIGPYFNRTST